MKKKTIILVIVLFALLVAGMFVYTRLKTTELNQGVSFTTLFKS